VSFPVSFLATAAADPASPTAAAPNRASPLSAELAQAITAGLPAYLPPPSTATAPPAEHDLPAPRNRIIRLPRGVVEGNRPTRFTARELHPDQGWSELAVKHFFTDTGLAPTHSPCPSSK
jgi:hypothetical protein